MGANSKDGANLTGLLFARRRRRGSADLLAKSSPNGVSQVVFGDWIFGASSVNYTLTAQGGSYILSGQSASLLRSKNLIASGGSYTLSGQTATLLRSKLLTGQGGSYSYTGQDVTIAYTPVAVNYTLTALGGEYSLVGQDAQITKEATKTKIGGDSAPVVVWEKRKKRKKTDESLTLAIESAYKQIMGEEPPKEVVKEVIEEAKREIQSTVHEDDSETKEWIREQILLIQSRIDQLNDEDEEEAILLLM